MADTQIPQICIRFAMQVRNECLFLAVIGLQMTDESGFMGEGVSLVVLGYPHPVLSFFCSLETTNPQTFAALRRWMLKMQCYTFICLWLWLCPIRVKRSPSGSFRRTDCLSVAALCVSVSMTVLPPLEIENPPKLIHHFLPVGSDSRCMYLCRKKMLLHSYYVFPESPLFWLNFSHRLSPFFAFLLSSCTCRSLRLKWEKVEQEME